MAKVKLVANLGKGKKTIYKKDNFKGPMPVSVDQYINGVKSEFYPVKDLVIVAPPPIPIDKPLVVSAGDDITVKEGQFVLLDGAATDEDNAIIRATWTQVQGPLVQLVVDPNDNTNVSFTAPPAIIAPQLQQLVFQLEAENDAGDIMNDQVVITVTKDGEEQPPLPPITNILWDSNIHAQWNNGIKRTISGSEGSLKPNGKGIECRASGNPKLVIDGDGVAHLVAGTGEAEDLSLKLDCLHNEGGDCAHRFGGWGCSIDRKSVGMKTESCHNNHENSASEKIDTIKNGEWHKFRFEVRHDGTKAVNFVCLIDGKVVMEHSHKNPKPEFIEKIRQETECSFWIRINNSDHGRIYVHAAHYDAALEGEWMWPGDNSVSLRDVQLIALNAA